MSQTEMNKNPTHQAQGGAAMRRRFLGVVAPLLVLTATALYLLVDLNRLFLQKTFELRETRNVSYAVHQLQEQLDMGLSDARVLTQVTTLREFLASQSPVSRARLERELIAFVGEKGIYAQARILDAEGMEIIRVEARPEGAVAIAQPQLQDKSDRYYFQEAIRLAPSQVYISPLDLNVEQGVIEDPPKPMIRVATPLVDPRGGLQGVLVLNVRMGPVLERVRASVQEGVEELWLLNHDGYWLIAPDPEQEWGFMMPERATDNLWRDDSKLWKQLQDAPFGQFVWGSDLLTFAQVSPLGQKQSVVYSDPQHTLARLLAADTPWIVAIRLPQTIFQEMNWMGSHPWRNGALMLLILGINVVVGRLAWRFVEELGHRREAEDAYREERALLTPESVPSPNQPPPILAQHTIFERPALSIPLFGLI